MRRAALALILSTCLAGTAAAQLVPPLNSRPAPAAKIDTIPPARDIAFPGTIRLTVDASDVTRGIFKVHEHVPVPAPGDFVLLYPKWLPGTHSPSGQINKVAGFRATAAGGKELAWVRDSLDVYAFHVNVPKGVTAIDVDFQYVSPTAENQGRVVATPDLASIEWIANSVYPAGYFVRDIPVQASVIVPAGWKIGTALRPSAQTANRSDYPVTSYEILMDSPLIAGPHYRRIELSPDVAMDVIADNDAELAATPEQIAAHRNLVSQAVKLFGAQHYDHYDFLLTISDYLGGEGLEHHRSSEDGVKRGYFTDWENKLRDRNLLPHEYSHSWDGKYRRAADLWTPDYRTPMQGSMMWVYEGQTQFWGYVLGARSGMLSKQDTLDAIASTAATYGYATPGRTWRPLVDTTNDPTIAQRAPQPWRSWQRSEDYYSEGQLIWIDVDRIIRQQSGGKRSIDDFARAFYGMRDRDYGELTYTLDDIVATLNSVLPYDWRGYLQRRVYSVAAEPPLEGITQGGYKLVFTPEPTKWIKSAEKNGKNNDLTYSGGFVVGNDGKITTVIWDSAAFNAGITVGSEIVAVNGRKFDGDALKAAIKSASASGPAPELLIHDGDVYRTAKLDWHGGLRYPRLQKVGTAPGTLDALLAPR